VLTYDWTKNGEQVTWHEEKDNAEALRTAETRRGIHARRWRCGFGTANNLKIEIGDLRVGEQRQQKVGPQQRASCDAENAEDQPRAHVRPEKLGEPSCGGQAWAPQFGTGGGRGVWFESHARS
jgi:hypothetical protein